MSYVSKPVGKSGVKRLLLLELYFIAGVGKAVGRQGALSAGPSPQVEKVFCICSLSPSVLIILILSSCASVRASLFEDFIGIYLVAFHKSFADGA